MHIRPSILAVALGLLRTASAVFIDDAWTVDYHLALLGTPQPHTTFFHQPFAGSRASLLYTLSERSVLGAINPKDGSVVWRQQLEILPNATAPTAAPGSTFLRAGDDQDVVISGGHGVVEAWSAADGRQAWSVDLKGAVVEDLEILEMPTAEQEKGGKDVMVLSAGTQATLRRIDGSSGHIKWSFVDDSGDIPFQVSASATNIYYISLHSTMRGGLKIKVVSLDPVTGRKVDQYTLSSDSELVSKDSVLAVGANTASPIIAWTSKTKDVLKVNVIGSSAISTFNIEGAQNVERVTLHAPSHVNARPHFLVHYETATQHWADVYHVDLRQSSVQKAYTLPKLGGRGAFSTSTSEANVYFTRISEGEVSVVSSASHGLLSRWPLKGLAPWNDSKPVHAVSEVSVKADVISAVRTAVYFTSGDWLLIRDGTAVWERPEGLSGTVTAIWAYPPVEETLVHELQVEGHSGPLHAYVHRVIRHFGDLKTLPDYLNSLPRRLLHSVGIGHEVDTTAPSHDNFGYKKTIVCATDTNRLIALNAGDSGSVKWNIPLPGSAQAQLHASPDGTIIVESADGTANQRIDVGSGKLLAPESSTSRAVSQLTFRYSIEDGKVVGTTPPGTPLWQFAPLEDQRILSLVARPLADPVASIGKVLGDRRVLYKYLNPNVLMITTVCDTKNTATVNIIDAVSGSIIHTAEHESIDASLPFAAVMSENWFAYSFTTAQTDSGSKGHQLIVGEMYESPLPNDRGPLGAATNASDIQFSYDPYVVTQAYRISEPISHLAVTQTRQGITSRLLLAALPGSGALVGIPRSIIDPRRPVGREPTAQEAMEGLMRYAPILDFDPKWFLTHQREVIGIEKITTSPAILESTSLIFAYGLDIFGTRASPSFAFDVLGKDFNKIQMLGTVAALAVGTLIVAPLVNRKQINARWQFP